MLEYSLSECVYKDKLVVTPGEGKEREREWRFKYAQEDVKTHSLYVRFYFQVHSRPIYLPV